MGFESDGAHKFLQAQQEQEDLQWRKSYILAAMRQYEGEESIKQLAREHRLTASYLVRLARVAADVPMDERDPKLSFSHYAVSWAAGDWRKWTTLASTNDWSLAELKRAILAEKGVDPDSASKKAGHGARAIKSAADEAVGTPVLREVASFARSAFEYVQSKEETSR